MKLILYSSQARTALHKDFFWAHATTVAPHHRVFINSEGNATGVAALELTTAASGSNVMHLRGNLNIDGVINAVNQDSLRIADSKVTLAYNDSSLEEPPSAGITVHGEPDDPEFSDAVASGDPLDETSRYYEKSLKWVKGPQGMDLLKTATGVDYSEGVVNESSWELRGGNFQLTYPKKVADGVVRNLSYGLRVNEREELEMFKRYWDSNLGEYRARRLARWGNGNNLGVTQPQQPIPRRWLAAAQGGTFVYAARDGQSLYMVGYNEEDWSQWPNGIYDAGGALSTRVQVGTLTNQLSYIVKYRQTTGIAQWLLQIGIVGSPTSGAGPNNVTEDKNGNVVVALGMWSLPNNVSTVDIEFRLNAASTSSLTVVSLPKHAENANILAVLRFTPSGMFLNATVVPNSNSGVVAFDHDNNMYIHGFEPSSTPFLNSDGTASSIVAPKPGSAYNSSYLVKYSSTGIVQWAAGFAISSRNSNTPLAIDSAGNIYVSGVYDTADAGKPVYNAGNVPSATVLLSEDEGVAVVKFSPQGIAQWILNIDTPDSSEFVTGLSVSPTDELFVTVDSAATENPTEFRNADGSQVTLPMQPVRADVIYLSKYNTSTGNLVWGTRIDAKPYNSYYQPNISYIDNKVVVCGTSWRESSVAVYSAGATAPTVLLPSQSGGTNGSIYAATFDINTGAVLGVGNVYIIDSNPDIRDMYALGSSVFILMYVKNPTDSTEPVQLTFDNGDTVTTFTRPPTHNLLLKTDIPNLV